MSKRICDGNLSTDQIQILFYQAQLPSIPSTSGHAQNVLEVHRAVAYAQLYHSMISTFFSNLVTFTQHFQAKLQSNISTTRKKRILNLARSHVQSRLAFLSFVYSSLGSPRDFELPREHVVCLWDTLIGFQDDCIKDDLFSWFLTQAKSKEQHAISIETFKLIFVNKMPLLDPNGFSQMALHLYQELFKIYKFSFSQQQVIETFIICNKFRNIYKILSD
jgi:ubiquitin carboxyl-terminal hydrolase 34